MWQEAEDSIAKQVDRRFPKTRKRTEVNAAIKAFNGAFGELFKEDSPEYILKHAKPFLDRFNHNLGLKLRFPQVRPDTEYDRIKGCEVRLELSCYAGKSIPFEVEILHFMKRPWMPASAGMTNKSTGHHVIPTKLFSY